MPSSPLQMTAGGNINPARFVKPSTTEDNRVLEATATDYVVGVSQKGTRRTPYPGLDDGYAAIAGEGIGVFFQNQVAPLTLGGTVAAGDKLKPTTGGKAIAASVGDYYGAIAPMAGIADQIMDCQVVLGKL